MKVSAVSQYSVFLSNEPGSLRKFAQMLYGQGLDIVGFMCDVHHDAEVVKFVIESLDSGEEPPVSRLITKAGYTSVKTDILCVEEEGKHGAVFKVSKILEDGGINITTMYGGCVGASKHGRMYLNVDNFEQALQLLSDASRRAS